VSGAVLPDLIGRVTMRAATDTPAIRLGLGRTVGRLRLPAPGPSRHEILIVRRLDDRLDPTGRAESSMISALEASLGNRLAEARRNAVPLDGRPVPSRAPAVVARDLAQLLCQYVIDMHDTRAGAWWWATLAGRLGRQPAFDLLAARPREAPHVIADLVRRGREDALGPAGRAAAGRLLAQMAAVYAAPRLAEFAAVPEPSRRAGAPTPRPEANRDDRWRDLVVAVAVQLSLDPVAARTAGFARFAASLVGAATSASEEIGGAAVRPASAPAVPPLDGVHDRATAVRPARPAGPPRDLGPGVADAARSALPPLDRCGPADPTPGETPPATVRKPADRTPAVQRLVHGNEAQPPRDEDAAAPAPERAPDHRGVVTGLGGVMFLVNLVGELGIPAVFEEDWQLRSAVGAWGALDLLARCLLPRRDGWHLDGVWDVLSALAGGSPFWRAAAMTAPASARLPATWLELGATSDRPAASLSRTLAAPATGAVRRWLRLVRPAVTGLLAERLRVTAGEIPETMLLRPARIVHDRTHVDIAFPVAAAAVPVRRAGLDRDPGWVPELARVVAYQFDDEAFGGVPS